MLLSLCGPRSLLNESNAGVIRHHSSLDPVGIAALGFKLHRLTISVIGRHDHGFPFVGPERVVDRLEELLIAWRLSQVFPCFFVLVFVLHATDVTLGFVSTAVDDRYCRPRRHSGLVKMDSVTLITVNSSGDPACLVELLRFMMMADGVSGLSLGGSRGRTNGA